MNAPTLNPAIAEAEKTAALERWEKAKTQQEYWKEEELAARTAYVKLVRDPAKAGTTETVELNNGYAAKLKVPVRFGWAKTADDKTDTDAINACLDEIEERTPAGKVLAERLVKWSPELSKTEYDNLPDEDKAIIDRVIVKTEGTPTLEIKEPPKKAKK